MFQNFYEGKTVFVTGHTGFKGGWLCLWLKMLGARVHGFSLPPPTRPSLHEVIRTAAFDRELLADVRDAEALCHAVTQTAPDVVFHLAAQPIVRRSYVQPLETLQTNVLGTAHLLEAVRQAPKSCTVVLVTTDKCYENRETGQAYREEDALGGYDVYSASKAAAELVAQSWRRSFFLPDKARGHLATVRAGNVIGGGDYAEDRIVPDCIRALQAGQSITVRNPAAVRPWQHVLDCLSGYLWLGARLGLETGKASPLASAFNFGPEAAGRQPVLALVQEILKSWPGSWVNTANTQAPHEARLLSLSIEKSERLLEWEPSLDFADTVLLTVEWYRTRHLSNQADMAGYSQKQITAYADIARSRNAAWARS